MKHYIGLIIWDNVYGKKVCQLIQDETTDNTAYFESVEEVLESVNPNFPCDVVVININTKEVYD